MCCGSLADRVDRGRWRPGLACRARTASMLARCAGGWPSRPMRRGEAADRAVPVLADDLDPQSLQPVLGARARPAPGCRVRCGRRGRRRRVAARTEAGFQLIAARMKTLDGQRRYKPRALELRRMLPEGSAADPPAEQARASPSAARTTHCRRGEQFARISEPSVPRSASTTPWPCPGPATTPPPPCCTARSSTPTPSSKLRQTSGLLQAGLPRSTTPESCSRPRSTRSAAHLARYPSEPPRRRGALVHRAGALYRLGPPRRFARRRPGRAVLSKHGSRAAWRPSCVVLAGPHRRAARARTPGPGDRAACEAVLAQVADAPATAYFASRATWVAAIPASSVATSGPPPQAPGDSLRTATPGSRGPRIGGGRTRGLGPRRAEAH